MKRGGPLRRSPIRYKKKAASAAVKLHWDAIAELGCIVTRNPDASIHHVHGGSVTERLLELGLPSRRGTGQKLSDWLVIPLVPVLHYIGPNAIDGSIGVDAWEEKFGKQAHYIDQVGDEIGRSLWDLYAQSLRE